MLPLPLIWCPAKWLAWVNKMLLKATQENGIFTRKASPRYIPPLQLVPKKNIFGADLSQTCRKMSDLHALQKIDPIVFKLTCWFHMHFIIWHSLLNTENVRWEGMDFISKFLPILQLGQHITDFEVLMERGGNKKWQRRAWLSRATKHEIAA